MSESTRLRICGGVGSRGEEGSLAFRSHAPRWAWNCFSELEAKVGALTVNSPAMGLLDLDHGCLS